MVNVRLLDDPDVRVQGTARKTAVTEWLRLVRNSLHGFEKPSPKDRALLAAHVGNIPGDFADVAWLHILDIVTHPEKLAQFVHLDRVGDSRQRRAGSD